MWNPLDLDLEDDSDGDGLPDAILEGECDRGAVASLGRILLVLTVRRAAAKSRIILRRIALDPPNLLWRTRIFLNTTGDRKCQSAGV